MKNAAEIANIHIIELPSMTPCNVTYLEYRLFIYNFEYSVYLYIENLDNVKKMII